MTELERYLAEEVAEDHVDGIITRREAMRRLGLLGVTGAAASALLSGVGAKAAGAASPPAHGRPSRHDVADGVDRYDQAELAHPTHEQIAAGAVFVSEREPAIAAAG